MSARSLWAMFLVLICVGVLGACSKANSPADGDVDTEVISEEDKDSDAEPEAETDTEVEAEPETEAEPESEPENEAESEAIPETEAEAEPEVETEAEAETEAELESPKEICLATAGSCYIGDVCYAAGAPKPDNACLLCDASANAQDWSAAADTVVCDYNGDADPCATSYHCDGAGACTTRLCGGHGSCTNAACICDNTRMNGDCTACADRNTGYPACRWDGTFPNGYCATHLCTPILSTNQTLCYNESDTIACPSSGGAAECGATDFCGQDAQYARNSRLFTCYNAAGIAAECSSLNPAGADETVVDGITGLIWERLGVSGMSWSAAAEYCAHLTYAGKMAWRLPTPFEWAGIQTQSGGRSIDTSVFPSFASSFYWSAAADVGNSATAWSGTANDGSLINTMSIANAYNAACVQGGPSEQGTVEYKFLEISGEEGSQIATDQLTKLVWASASSSGLSWKQALAYCESLDYAGKSDWRLPNRNELMSLVNYGKKSPASDLPNMTNDLFWTSTTFYGNAGSAYFISFLTGVLAMEPKTAKYTARCVRGPDL